MIRDLADSTVASVIQRHEDYWYNREVDVDDTSAIRPLFQFRPAQPLADTPHPHPLTPPAPLDPLSFRDHIEERYDDGGLLSDDLFNMISTGIPSEVLVGCPMVVRAGTHWAESCFVDWGQLDTYQVQKTIWYQRLLYNTRRAVDAVDTDRYPFCCMAFRGAVDMAEAMLTGERLCTAVFDHPQRLKDLLARITDIIIETASAHADLLPMYRGGQFNSYGIWTPGRTVTFTVDGACLFSPACYEDFFLPCDQRLCEAFDTPFVHLHAAARQHFSAWTDLVNLGLQCVIDQAWMPAGHNNPIGPQLTELLADFQAIRRHKSLMLYGFWDEKLIADALAHLPPGGSAITGMVEAPDILRQRYITAN